MSILVVGPDLGMGRAIVERLVAEGDEVRVVTDQPADASLWKQAGAHVAVGDLTDADLIERAALGCRTLVVAGDSETDPIVTGAHAARVGRAIVLVPTARRVEVVLERTEKIRELDYVFVTTKRGKLPLASAVAQEDVATAVSVADDLAGNPKLVVDLGTAEGRELIGLGPA